MQHWLDLIPTVGAFINLVAGITNLAIMLASRRVGAQRACMTAAAEPAGPQESDTRAAHYGQSGGEAQRGRSDPEPSPASSCLAW